jgi:hypothetical protein
MSSVIYEECLECDGEFEVQVTLGPLEGDSDYEYPDACPHCGASLDYPEVDEREDFHSDI